jgi:hypothetical protein
MTSVAPSAGTSNARSSGRLVKILIVAAIVVVGAAAAALAVGPPSSSGDEPFHGSAVPPLYSDAELAVVDAPLKDAEAQGHRVARRWLNAHPAATDQAFSNWAIQQIGPPPGNRVTRTELGELHRIAAHRNRVGTTAATWLEAHGKKQPWSVFRKQEKAFLSQQRYVAVKQALTEAFSLGGTLQANAKQRYNRRSPYQADPSLQGLNQAKVRRPGPPVVSVQAHRLRRCRAGHPRIGGAASACRARLVHGRDRLLAPVRRGPLPVRPDRWRVPRHAHRRL